eukprot:12635327-Ditylum_brightwellii.AAC.1
MTGLNNDAQKFTTVQHQENWDVSHQMKSVKDTRKISLNFGSIFMNQYGIIRGSHHPRVCGRKPDGWALHQIQVMNSPILSRQKEKIHNT